MSIISKIVSLAHQHKGRRHKYSNELLIFVDKLYLEKIKNMQAMEW